MSENIYVNDAKVMAKGQITIPKKVRETLGLATGDRVTFVVEGNDVKIVNSAVYAMMQFQKQMKGEGEKAGLFSEDDVAEWIRKSRNEDQND